MGSQATELTSENLSASMRNVANYAVALDSTLEAIRELDYRRGLKDGAAMSEGIYWLQPIVVDGVTRWPPCEAQVTDITSGTRNREQDEKDCALSAKIDYRGKLLCQRHASKLLLREFVKESPERRNGEP